MGCKQTLWLGNVTSKIIFNNLEKKNGELIFCKTILKWVIKEGEKAYIFKATVRYSEEPNELHSGIPFLPDKMKIKKIRKTCM